VQATVLYDPDQQPHQTRMMRSKEEANDYRYFPDPDLLPVAKLVANWIQGEFSARLNREDKNITDAPLKPVQLAVLIGRIADGTISNNAAKQVLDHLWTPKMAELVIGDSLEEVTSGINALIEAKGLKQMSDSGEVERIIDEVLAANAKSVEEFRAGKEKAFNALVGQVMKATKGKANPAQVNDLLKAKLAG
jgi:aspartyl-tRNA(Asn)/glutamyl-tRNA(Gln) amidotransferase subunit B